MGKYTALAEQVVEKVGGVENIKSVTHCATRLRLQVRDEDKVDVAAIKDIDGVVTVVQSAGQQQVVIGPHVTDVYDDVCAIPGIKAGGEVDAAPGEVDDLGEKRGVGATVLDFISSMMGPIITIVCGCGILKGINALLLLTGLMTEADTLYMVLDAAADCVYYYMPVFFGYSIAKKLKMNPILGMCLGMILVYPTLQNMEEASLFGLDISGISYKQSMLPIVVVMLVAAQVDKFLKRVLPEIMSSFLEPALLFAIMAPLSFAFIGPVMTVISNVIADTVTAILGFSPVLAGAVVCAAWQVLVLFGVHTVLATVIFTLMFATGSSPLYPLTAVPGFAIFGIALAMYLRSKSKKTKDIALPATISAFFGVTEPAMYGLMLPKPKWLAVACAISGLCGAYMGFTNVQAYQFGGSGLLCLTMSLSETDPSSVINFAIAIAVATVASFVIGFLFYRDDPDTQAA